MAPKNCRHVSQALRLADFRRALRTHEVFVCQSCAPSASKQQSSSRAKASKKSASSAAAAPSAVDDAIASWERSAAWEDLCVCITCGFIGCFSRNHFSQHAQLHAKHFVGFHAGAKTFWCCPCKHEIDESSAKVQDARRECADAFSEIASKQQRKARNRVVAVAAPDASDPSSCRSETAPGNSDTTAPATESDAPADDRPKRRSRNAPADASDVLAAASVSTVVGFTNVGNTCYFNAATQALLTAAHYFPEHMHLDASLEATDTPILTTFSMLHETIKKKARRRAASDAESSSRSKAKSKTRSSSKPDGVLTVAPLLKELRKKFAQFRGSYQQDAHELLLSFLWAIDEETDPPARADAASASDDDSDASSPTALQQIFVKTETGETVALQVPAHASVAELQQLIATRLNLDAADMSLSPARPSSAAPSRDRSVSKLNWTRHLFGGELTTVITCRACGHESRTPEDAFQVSVPVPATTTAALSAITCLEHFLSETALLVSAKNGYECAHCSQTARSPGADANESAVVLRDASMRLMLSQLPRVLVIHLKRLGRLKKITQHIQFDAILDMAPYWTPRASATGDVAPVSTLYELIAVVVHMGNKRSGHYVAYVSRSRRRDALLPSPPRTADGSDDAAAGEEVPHEHGDSDDDSDPRAEIHTSEHPSRSWYYISDTVVKRVAFEQVLQCEAYMLFYRQLPDKRPSRASARRSSS